MHRNAGVRQCGRAQQQRRSYLNLYPKPDVGTMSPFSDTNMYYALPDYVKHKDHKQLRPVMLDETNTTELTREEERVQRVKVMQWRAGMARHGRRATAVSQGLPAWEERDDKGRGRFRRSWSGAQALEFQLRKGVAAVDLDPASQIKEADPHGVTTQPDPINAAWATTAQRRPLATSFKQLISTPSVLNDLSTRFYNMTQVQLPVTGLDFPEIVSILSKTLIAKGQNKSAVMAYQRMTAWLADFARACADGIEDDVLRQLKGVTALEAELDWCSSEWNDRIADDDLLGEDSFSALLAGYASNGSLGFWSAIADNKAPEFKPDFQIFIKNILAPDFDLQAALSECRTCFTKLAALMEKRHARQMKAGLTPQPYAATDLDYIKLADQYFLKPFKELSASGDFVKGFRDENDTGDASEAEVLELQGILDMEVSKGIVFSDWLRWEFVELFTVASKLHGKEADSLSPAAAAARLDPTVALAARLRNLSLKNCIMSFYDDLRAHAAITFSKIYTPTAEDALPAFQFMRCVVNRSNVQNYNARMSRAFFLSSMTAANYARDKKLVTPALPPTANVYDVNAMIAELMLKSGSRDFTAPDPASSARESVRRDVQAVAMLAALDDAMPSAKQRETALQLAKWAAEDVNHCIGHLRRTIYAKHYPKTSIDGVKVLPVTADRSAPTSNEWHCGGAKAVIWDWTPSEEYAAQKSTPEIKAAAYEGMLQEQREYVGKTSPKEMLAECIRKADGYSTQANPMGDRGERQEWVFAKMYRKWTLDKRKEEVEEKIGVENRFKIHLALQRYEKDRLNTLMERRQAVQEAIGIRAAQVQETPEDDRLGAMLGAVQAATLEAFVERIEHVSGLDPVATELLNEIRSGTIQKMLESDSHLTEEDNWVYACDLYDSLETTCPNTGRFRVRLPFSRGGAELESGEYRVLAAGIGGNGRWIAEGYSDAIKVKNTLPAMLNDYMREGRAGKPHMIEMAGERHFLPAQEVEDVVEFLKTHKTTPCEFDLASETKIGADVLVLSQHGAPTPAVHLRVLKKDIEYDYHKEEARRDPVTAFVSRNDATKQRVWAETYPGFTGAEWAEAKDAVLGADDVGWWSYDGLQPTYDENWYPTDANPNPFDRYFDQKFFNLFTAYTTKFVKAQYEGQGIVSKLEISNGCRRVRVPLVAADPAGTVQVPEGELVFEAVDKRLTGSLNGDKFEIPYVRFEEAKWSVQLGDVVVKLPSGQEGEQVLSSIRALCVENNVDHNIDAAIRMQLHHLAEACKEAINGAHTRHCILASKVKAAEMAPKVPAPAAEPTLEEAVTLPTIIKAWEDAGAPEAAASPTGLAIHRRRFDSWQLNSGKGRYDHSPTQDRQWEHPIEENPVLYGFQNVHTPMSRL